MVDVVKLIEKAEDYAGKARADLESSVENSRKAKASLYKIFGELRKLKEPFETETGICRKCAVQVKRSSLDANFFCKNCHDEDKGGLSEA